MPSQFLLTITMRRVLDEHEMRAFELERVLQKSKRTYPRVEAYEKALINSIKNHRELSKTYRPPLEA